jgi:hypothetical protein
LSAKGRRAGKTGKRKTRAFAGLRRFLAGLFLALLPVCLLPGQTAPAEWEIPRDTLAEAVIGVAEFRYIPARGDSSEPSRDFLGRNIARLFREKIREITTHEIGDLERGDYFMSIITAERNLIMKKLDELTANRDALHFSGTSLPDSSRKDSLAEEIETLRERLRILARLDPQTIEIIAEKKLVLTKETEAEGLLSAVMDPRAAAAKAKVDYLLWGTLREEAAGMLSLSVSLYAARARITLFSGTLTSASGELDRLAGRMFLRLAASLAGRPWASLDIRTDPPDAYIYVDGELAGIGRARLAYVRPGGYRLSFYADGYDVLEERVSLEPESVQEKDFRLAPVAQETILLETIPPGADVYFGALKKGVTPLILPLGATPDILSLNLEGYKSKVFPSTAQDITAPHTLPRDIISWDERIATKRSDFYRSLGFLILSVPIPVLLYGAYQNEAFGFMQYTGRSGFDYDEAMEKEKKYRFLYYAYFGSLFLSGSLFVNTMQKLIDYIRTGEESQRYPGRMGAEDAKPRAGPKDEDKNEKKE